MRPLKKGFGHAAVLNYRKIVFNGGAGKIFFYGAMGELMGTYNCAAGCTTDPPTKEEGEIEGEK